MDKIRKMDPKAAKSLTVKNKVLNSPYDQLPDQKFWKRSVAAKEASALLDLFQPKFQITKKSKIVTAGSCFAQHITHHLRENGFAIQDVEPAPQGLSFEEAQRLSYQLYSARYGNIYTIRQLLQLYQESLGLFQPSLSVWERNGIFFDALRPSVQPGGLDSIAQVSLQRKEHLVKVKQAFHLADVFVFTFGLSECWEHIASGTVYPMAPGTIAGHFDEQIFRFKNLSFSEIKEDFLKFFHLLKEHNNKVKFLLTVSPVHLVATASEQHVLSASIYSKSLLRAVAGELTNELDEVDYFPSFEIITNPAAKGQFYKDNSRSVSILGRDTVMKAFMKSYGYLDEPITRQFVAQAKAEKDLEEVETDAMNEVCDKELLNAFGPISDVIETVEKTQNSGPNSLTEFYPNQHKGLYHFKNIAVKVGDAIQLIFFEEKKDIFEAFQADIGTSTWIKSASVVWQDRPEMEVHGKEEPVFLFLPHLNPAHCLVDSIFSTLVEIKEDHTAEQPLFNHYFIASPQGLSAYQYKKNWSLFVHQQLLIIDDKGEVFSTREKKDQIFFFKHLVVTKYMKHRFAADWTKLKWHVNRMGNSSYIDTSPGMYPQAPLDYIHRQLLQKCFAFSSTQEIIRDRTGKARVLIYNRANTKWRKWANAEEISAFIKEQYKDEISDLYFLSEDYAAYGPKAQAALFHAVNIIIMPHGSALANAIFAKPGTTIIEFNPSKKPYGWFHFCDRMGMDFHVVHPENFWYHNEKSFTVKPELLKPILDKAVQKY